MIRRCVNGPQQNSVSFVFSGATNLHFTKFSEVFKFFIVLF